MLPQAQLKQTPQVTSCLSKKYVQSLATIATQAAQNSCYVAEVLSRNSDITDGGYSNSFILFVL